MCKLPSLRWSYKHSIKMCNHSVENKLQSLKNIFTFDNNIFSFQKTRSLRNREEFNEQGRKGNLMEVCVGGGGIV